MEHDLHLSGHGIRLEPLRVGHAQALHAVSDEALWQGMTTPYPTSVEQFEAHIARQVAGADTLPFAVVQDDGTVSGSTILYDLSPSQERVEIGSTWYGRRFWGGHTNPAAKRLLFGHAFDALRLHRVGLRCDARNTRSAGAIQRLGAVPEGILRGHRVAADGSRGDTAYFSVLRPEWPDVRAGLDARINTILEARTATHIAATE